MKPLKPQNDVPWHVAESYDASILGAPFKVTLKESVCVRINPTSGDEEIKIPDLVGLISAVVRARVVDPRKLSGADIKFIRKALDVRANKLAAFLAMTPEHFSRLEGGDKVMGPQSEKSFRLFAFAATFQREPQKLLDGLVNPTTVEKPTKKSENLAKRFVELFFSMEIEAVRSADELIEYVLKRSPQHACGVFEDCDDEGDWEDLTLAEAA